MRGVGASRISSWASAIVLSPTLTLVQARLGCCSLASSPALSPLAPSRQQVIFPFLGGNILLINRCPSGSLSLPSRAPSTRVTTGDLSQEPEDSLKIRKSKLPLADRQVVTRACDLSIVEVVDNVGWEDDMGAVARKCYNQALLEDEARPADLGLYRLYSLHDMALNDSDLDTPSASQWEPHLLKLVRDYYEFNCARRFEFTNNSY